MPGERAEFAEIDAETVRPIGAAARCCRVRRQPWSLLTAAAALIAAMGCIGCQAATPLPPPAPPPAPPPVVQAPPPPPKCEKVEEGCVAGAETRARIGQGDWQFAPPTSWVYAQGEDLTIATGKNGRLAVAVRQALDIKKERVQREEALRLLADKLGVTLPKKKTFFVKKPDQKQKVGDVDVDFYQFEGAKLEGRSGPLLFFVVRASNEHVLIGLGFVSDDDGDDTDRAIMAAIESMGPTATEAAAAKKAP